MKRSSSIFITTLLILTIILSGVIIWILLFKQSAVPEFTVRDGKDAVVDYDKLTSYIDIAIESKFKELPIPSNGKDALPIDYSVINTYIDSKIANIPTPKNGIDGLNGKSCSTVQTEEGAIIACEDGSSAIVRNGNDAYIELRCNDNKNRWEVRYVEGGTWGLLNNKVTKCTVLGG